MTFRTLPLSAALFSGGVPWSCLEASGNALMGAMIATDSSVDQDAIANGDRPDGGGADASVVAGIAAAGYPTDLRLCRDDELVECAAGVMTPVEGPGGADGGERRAAGSGPGGALRIASHTSIEVTGGAAVRLPGAGDPSPFPTRSPSPAPSPRTQRSAL